MAERRMFAKTIIDSDAFLDMPVTARLLYYDLAMRADDDGFVNSPKKIMRIIGASQDDLSILIMRKFILPFDNGVVVIKHWRIHNYIRKDTYTQTPYLDEKAMLTIDENKAYKFKNSEPSTISQRAVDEPSTQVSIGKVSIDKVSVEEEDRSSAPAKVEILASPIFDLVPEMCDEIMAVWNEQQVTQNINRIPIMSKRANDTRLCFQYVNTFSEYLEVIRQVDKQGWFQKLAKQGRPIKYDWFCNPNNFLKVIEGNYVEDHDSGSMEGLEVIEL